MKTQTPNRSSVNPVDISDLTVRVLALTVSLLLFLTSYSVQTILYLLRPLTPLERFFGITKDPISYIADAMSSASLLVLVLASFILGPRIIRRGRTLQKLNHVEPTAYQTFVECCNLCKLERVPEFYVTEESSDDCFAFGMVPSRASLIISRGLLLALDEDHLRALFLHEIGHIVGKDVGLMTWGK